MTDKVNSGSPVGPGFVVYERAPGLQGYDLDMALASVGKGWHGLIRMLFDAIEWNSKNNPKLGFNGVYVTQVKEKFGTLRLYFSGGNAPGCTSSHWSYVDGFVAALEAMSAHICEACGSPGVTRYDRSWVVTVCDECNKKDRPLVEQPA